MPFRLIGTILLVVFVAVFTGLNLDNKCNLWFFYTFQNVPVYVSILAGFVAGVLVTLPFTFIKKHKTDKKNTVPKKSNKVKSSEATAVSTEPSAEVNAEVSYVQTDGEGSR